MYLGKRVVFVMPAYNAVQTVARTVDEVLQQQIVDEIIVVDDRSRDQDLADACGFHEGICCCCLAGAVRGDGQW
jgi:hypothetical protein